MPDSPLRVSLPIMQIDLNNPFGAALAESWREVPHDGAFDLRLSESARDELLEITRTQDYASPHWHRLALAALSWRQRVGSGDLQVLQHLRERFKHAGVVLYPHQIETVRKVIDEMDGRAILADEVGLGKTIEAGMILKEYILRGRVDKALILVPAALQWQWYSELKEKFGILAAILRTEHDWERCSVIIASIDAAKRALHKPYLERIAFDLLIVDEAHRLKNRKTRNWSFVNDLHKKYFLMLTATPIQNDLQELHNLIALLKPDQLGTKQSFKREFVFDKHTPKRTEQLRERLSAVLIRNRRGDKTVQFTKRHVRSLPIRLSEREQRFYERASEVVRTLYQNAAGMNVLPLMTLQRELASSSFAAALTLDKLRKDIVDPKLRQALDELVLEAIEIKTHAKIEALKQMLPGFGEKVIVFTAFKGTLELIRYHIEPLGLKTLAFDGSLSTNRKNWVREMFRRSGDVLVATESGGEGLNFQFCRNVINYDLPWNPMRLEQRIGRVHRLGQTQDVHVWNLAAEGTIESHILNLLERKIGMFQMAIGELDEILAHLKLEKDIETFLGEILLGASGSEEIMRRFDALASQFEAARKPEGLNIDDILEALQ